MSIINPFAGDSVKGDVWEQGYLAGFSSLGDGQPPPFAPDLVDVYVAGTRAGSDDRSEGPGDGERWAGFEELAEHIFLHAVGEFLTKIIGKTGGLIALVVSVLDISDTPLHPLPPEFRGPSDQLDDLYVAVCPRDDHSLVIQGTTNDGYWTGTGRTAFADAATDMKTHGHAEAFVARCSRAEGTCGAVWAVK